MDRFLKIFAVAAVITVCLIAYERDIPAPPEQVFKTFEEMYGGAAEIEWEKHLNHYKAEFIYDRHEMEARFSRKGLWQSSRKEVLVSEVPDEVMGKIEELNTENWQIDDVFLYTMAKGNVEYYSIELDKESRGKDKTLYIYPNGIVCNMPAL